MDDQCDAIDSTLGACDGFRINKEFEQDLISFGQVRLGRAIGPFRRREIGKIQKPPHIIGSRQWSVVRCGDRGGDSGRSGEIRRGRSLFDVSLAKPLGVSETNWSGLFGTAGSGRS